MYRNKLGFIIKDDFYPITGKKVMMAQQWK